MQQETGFALNGLRVLSYFICFAFMLVFTGRNEVCGQEVERKNRITIQDLDSFMKELERIRDRYREQHRFPQNAFVEGVINPGNRKFTLVMRDGKMRLDMDVLIPGANGTSERRTVHRLNDGRIFYKVNNDVTVINPLDHVVLYWQANLASNLSRFFMPELNEIKPVDEFCDQILQLIRSNKEKLIKAIASSQVAGQITINGPLHTIEVSGPMADDGSGRIDVRRVVLDARYGYLPVQSERVEMPAPGASAWKKTYQIKTQYQEVAPGIFFLSEGRSEYNYHNPKISDVETESDSYSFTTIVKKSEVGTEISKRRIHSNTNIRITKVKTGDFEIADDYFDLQSLK
ncbi:hypothetical protein [Gimesia fumaroli]|uniref:Uncharacterized protein n=1 Tax=Gimesia fumaroli TaxID=2527976 RepID=A0A518IIH1_9PLAN|nr:hypothetical protein [Gimesia fumaroli]QDV52884.1 hypothetical protein Enr17x_49540 [Gimesia fumaroli]